MENVLSDSKVTEELIGKALTLLLETCAHHDGFPKREKIWVIFLGFSSTGMFYEGPECICVSSKKPGRFLFVFLFGVIQL